MTKAYESISKGLSEAISHASGHPKGKAKTHRIRRLDVKAIRRRVGMTQTQFASSFGIGLGTLRHWERGDRVPRGPARVLLRVIERDPKTVLQVSEADR